MDNDFEHDGFNEVSNLDDLSVLNGSDNLALEEASNEAPVANDPVPEILPEAETQSRYGSYGVIMRQRPLLTSEQELSLGQDLEDSRQNMTQALTRLPLSSHILAKAWEEALESDRPISEILQWPLGKPVEPTDESNNPGVQSPRLRMVLLAERYNLWKQGRDRRNSQTPGRCPPALRELFIECGPAFAMLCDIRNQLDGLYGPVKISQSSAARKKLEQSVGTDFKTIQQSLKHARQAERDFQQARQVMFESNIRLVFYIAGKFINNGLSMDDLVQEGSMGLLRAVEKFNFRLGYKFSTYATTWIWQAVTRAIANQRRTVRVPAHLHDKMLKVRSHAAAMEQRLERPPSLDELITDIDLPAATVKRALDAARRPLSLDTPIGLEDTTTYGDLTPDPTQKNAHEPVFDQQVHEQLEQLLAELPAREALILRLRHGLGGMETHTLEQIGQILSITRERTRQLQNRALKNLRNRLDPELAKALSA